MPREISGATPLLPWLVGRRPQARALGLGAGWRFRIEAAVGRLGHVRLVAAVIDQLFDDEVAVQLGAFGAVCTRDLRHTCAA